MSELEVNPATVKFINEESARRRKRRALSSVVGLLLVAGIAAGGYFGWNRYRANAAAAELKSITAELKPGSREGWEKMRALVDKGEITRDQARDAMEAARDAEFQKTADGYFKTPAKDRDKYLDQMIDEMQKRMADF